MSDGHEGDALKAYEMLVKDYPDSIYKKDADARIAALGKPDSQEFYAWFAKYPRPKIDEKRPRDKIGADDSESVTQEMIDKLIEASKGPGKKPEQDDESSPDSESKKPDPEKSDAKTEPQPDSVPEPESKSP
jgi:hypothetical protein